MSATKKQEAWTVANAKAHLSEVIERAQSEPQMITRNVTPSVVIVSVEEWNRKTERKGSLAAYLLSSPLARADLADTRLLDEPRDLAL
jgi:prevent-host-death family protein